MYNVAPNISVRRKSETKLTYVYVIVCKFASNSLSTLNSQRGAILCMDRKTAKDYSIKVNYIILYLSHTCRNMRKQIVGANDGMFSS